MEAVYYSVSQTAEILNVSNRTIYRWINEGVLNADKTDSGRVLIAEEEILKRKEKNLSSGISCIYVYDDRGMEFANSSVNHILHKENLIRSKCKIFIDFQNGSRLERERMLDFISTRASSKLYITSKNNLVQNAEAYGLAERYLKAVNCDMKVVY